jgi:hypothetical protein
MITVCSVGSGWLPLHMCLECRHLRMCNHIRWSALPTLASVFAPFGVYLGDLLVGESHDRVRKPNVVTDAG